VALHTSLSICQSSASSMAAAITSRSTAPEPSRRTAARLLFARVVDKRYRPLTTSASAPAGSDGCA
jgi:hypothetical protein